MNLAPIILFVYNRPEHTSRTLDALILNDLSAFSELYIFADGVKEGASETTINQIQQTRNIIREKKWPGQLHITESIANKGLAESVIEGVSQIISKHGKVIVLEDDLVTSPYFLTFMNDALTCYEHNSAVACISGYIYPVKDKLPETFFIKGADCWGWATWKRAWDIFEKNGKKLLDKLEIEKQIHEFDFNGSYPFTQMLKDQIENKNNSWAIRWYASCFLENKLCLYPGVSMVQNIGVDGSGVHSGISTIWNVKIAQNKIEVKEIPVVEDKNSKKSIIKFFMALKKANNSLLRKVILKLKKIIH